MAVVFTVGLKYEALRRECLDAVRQWPGCESVAGIQIIRSNKSGGFAVRVTLYGKTKSRLADRAIKCVRREKRRHFCQSAFKFCPFWPSIIERYRSLGGLRAKATVSPPAASRKPGRATRAAELAAKTIDGMIDPAPRRRKSASSAGVGLPRDHRSFAKTC
jgi:hypothetical protein